MQDEKCWAIMTTNYYDLSQLESSIRVSSGWCLFDTGRSVTPLMGHPWSSP